MIKTLVLGIVLTGLSLAGYLYFYLGVGKPVEITMEKRGPSYLLFKNHIGAYHKIGPILQEVEAWALKQNLPCPQTFGEYLDNPESVDQDRLRSRVGCVLTAPLQKAPTDFEYSERPAQAYVVGYFRGSPAIGPLKVYPKIKKYIAEQRLTASAAVLEVYRINGSEVITEYLFPVDQESGK